MYLTHSENNTWSGADCLVLNRGQLYEDDPYLKSACFHTYLFGYELTDTILVLTPDGKCIVLATKKKCEFLSPAKENIPEGSSITGLTLLQRNKADENAENYATLFKEAGLDKDPAANGDSKKKVGIFKKEWANEDCNTGAILTPWQKKIDDADHIELVDVTPGISLVMAVKDAAELDVMKKSSVLSNKVMKHGVVKRLETIIDEEKSVTHEELAAEIDAIIEDPSKIKLNVPEDQVSSCYFPIVQSGGEYDVKVSAQSSDKTLKYDIITVSLGSRYQQYCSNIARTFLIDPPKAVSNTYETLLAAQEACLKAMQPGNKIKEIYGAAVEQFRKEDREDLIKCLPKNIGFSIGVDFRDPNLLLNAKSTVTIREGMVFNLSIGLNKIELGKTAKANCNAKSAVSIDELRFSWAFMVCNRAFTDFSTTIPPS